MRKRISGEAKALHNKEVIEISIDIKRKPGWGKCSNIARLLVKQWR